MASTRYTGADATMRGWLLCSPLWRPENLLAADSTYTQSGPRAPGAAEPSDPESAGVVLGLGECDPYLGTSSSTVVVECLQGGLPRLSFGAKVGYRLGTEAATAVRGWQPPNVLTGVSTPLGASTIAWDSLVAVAHPETGEVDWFIRNGSTGAISGYLWRGTDTNGWDGVALTVPVADCALGIGLARDSEGHLLFLAKVPAALPTRWSLFRTDAAYSTADWTEIARNVFDTEPDSGTQTLRMFEMPGGDLVIVGIYADAVGGKIRQWASDDGGARFRLVSATVAATTNRSDALLTPGGRIGVVRVTSGNVCNWYSSASAWTPALDAVAVQIATGVAEAWAAADPTGRIWVWTRMSASTDRVLVHVSDDEGATWTTLDQGLTDFNGDTGQYLTGGQAVWALGAGVLVCQSSDVIDAFDKSPLVLRCGGWSNVVCQGYNADAESELMGSGYGAGDVTWSGAMWLPVSEPASLSCWTATGAGTDTLQTDGSVLIATTANTRYYTSTTAPASTTTGMVSGSMFAVTADGGSHSTHMSQISDGVNASQVSIRASTTGFTIVDIGGGVLATVTISMTTPMCFLVLHDHDGTTAEVYYRRPYTSTWARACSTTTLATTASATAHFRWGNVASATVTSKWWYAWYRTNEAVDNDGLIGSPASAVAGWDWMFGRPLTGLLCDLDTVTYTHASGGAQEFGEPCRTFLRGADGPFRAGEVYTLTPTYDYPIEHLFPSGPQPGTSRPWRAYTFDNDDGIVCQMPSGEETSLSRSMGLAILQARDIRYVTLDARAGGAGAWTTLGTMDLATGFTSLSYTRTGNVIRIASTADASRYVWRGELVGGTVLDSSDPAQHLRIAAHTEGIWSDVAGRHVEIVVEDDADRVPGFPSSGTLHILAPSGVLVVHGISAVYDEYRVQVPSSGNPAEGSTREIGIALLGPIVAAGRAHGWGDVQTFGPNATSETGLDGVTRTRKRGPPIRTWTWAWPDGIDLSELRRSPPTPNYLAHGATSEGLANLDDVPYLVAGLLEDCRSGEIPLVALEYIPATSGTTINDPTLFLYCRIASSVGVENIHGDHETDPVVRVSPVTMQGIP